MVDNNGVFSKLSNVKIALISVTEVQTIAKKVRGQRTVPLVTICLLIKLSISTLSKLTLSFLLLGKSCRIKIVDQVFQIQKFCGQK